MPIRDGDRSLCLVTLHVDRYKHRTCPCMHTSCTPHRTYQTQGTQKYIKSFISKIKYKYITIKYPQSLILQLTEVRRPTTTIEPKIGIWSLSFSIDITSVWSNTLWVYLWVQPNSAQICVCWLVVQSLSVPVVFVQYFRINLHWIFSRLKMLTKGVFVQNLLLKFFIEQVMKSF